MVALLPPRPQSVGLQQQRGQQGAKATTVRKTKGGGDGGDKVDFSPFFVYTFSPLLSTSTSSSDPETESEEGGEKEALEGCPGKRRSLCPSILCSRLAVETDGDHNTTVRHGIDGRFWQRRRWRKGKRFCADGHGRRRGQGGHARWGRIAFISHQR